ncbi:aminotransferase [Sphingomonas koreensis]
MNPVYAELGTTIFEAMSARARANGAINLGQGFPDGEGCVPLIRAAAEALTTRSNQYPPMAGLPKLRQAIAAHYARHQQLDLSLEEVIITSGATEAIAAAFAALIVPGDEVILIQPLYDAYLPLVQRAGGVARLARLEPGSWGLTRAALEAVAGPRTRLIVVNNPVNPAGATLAHEELVDLAAFCVERDLIAVCDEVWEHVIYDGARHIPLMVMPGMRDRTVKIGSAGKIFALTGWKVGWMCAAPPIAAVLARAHQFMTFSTAPNLQWAVAQGLETQDAWIAESVAGFQRSRDRLTTGLSAAGYRVLPSAATWFLSIDLTASGIALDDTAFCERLVEEAGVAAIPVSAFYAQEPVTHLVRLCFAKADDVLDAAIGRMDAARRDFAR